MVQLEALKTLSFDLPGLSSGSGAWLLWVEVEPSELSVLQTIVFLIDNSEKCVNQIKIYEMECTLALIFAPC